MVTPGRALFEAYGRTHEARLKTALDTLRRQLASQPRTSDGGFWHKQIYPNQMWLDGLYMAGPFYAQYAVTFGEPAALADAARQIQLADSHLYDPKTGLYYHAWDSKRTQEWADPVTGRSPNFWGRSIGWYAMATVDELDVIPSGDPAVAPLSDIFRKTAAGIARWQDPASGVWWQVVDKGARAGNYREASASSMFVYALARGVAMGWLPEEPYRGAALRGYDGLIHEFVRTDPDGKISLTGCCSVAGLGNKNAAGRKRDGSFDYYVTEPVVANDLKGVAAFILASLAVQQLGAQAR
jgi:unsaturated rhamnogalacturonyl hydrolase